MNFKLLLYVLLLFTFSSTVNATIIWKDDFMFSQKCPKEKPFIGSVTGRCIGCDELSVIDITYEHKEDFNICKNRETIGWSSRLKVCPESAPLKDIQGNCVSCDKTEEGVYVENKTDCDVCSQAKFDKKNKICLMHDCPKETPMRRGTTCLSCNSQIADISPEECLKCSKNRKMSHGICIFKNSIYPDMPLINYDTICGAGCVMEAQFHSCDVSENIPTTKENCDQCPNRIYKNHLCIKDTVCSKNHFKGMTRTSECVDCDFLGAINTIKEYCNVCPNRKFKDGKCILKNCPKGTKRYGDFECSACDRSLFNHGECSIAGGGCVVTEPETKQECLECPNHSWRNGQCIKI